MSETSTLRELRAPASFADFLAPVAPSDFLERHWGRRYAVIHGEGGGRNRLFSFADVDHYLAIVGHQPAARLSIVQSQAERQRRAMDVSPRELREAFAGGATLRLDHMERYWPPVAELAALLAEALEARVKVNAYLTPAGTQGAPIHPDVQDVFALQLEGTKDWSIYDAVVYEPAEGHRLLRHLPPRERPRLDDEPPLAETARMEPGGLLYLPRGVLHRAVAAEDTASLHLAICVTPTYWVDVVKAAAEVASSLHPALSDRLPVGVTTDPSARDGLMERFREVLDRVAGDGRHLEGALRALEAERLERSPTLAAGQFAEMLHLEEMDDDTRLERRAAGPVRVSRSEAAAHLRCGRVELRTPPVAGEALEFVRDHERFRVGELPGLADETSRLVIARRLVREGLLRRAGD